MVGEEAVAVVAVVVSWMDEEDVAEEVEEAAEEVVEVLIRADEEEAVAHLISKVKSFIEADHARKTLHRNS
jgi:hypothetical protein